MCRSVRIDGSATPIIDTSSASRNSAPQSTINVPHARRLSWATAGCGKETDTNSPFGYCLTEIVHQLFDARQTMPTLDTESTPDLDTSDVLAVLRALADPVRLQIVRQLAGCPETGELKCRQIELPVTKSTASHHLKLLVQ